MSKFLDETGLSYFWSKVKTYLATNFLQKPSGGTTGQVLTKSETGVSWGDVSKEILKVTFSNYNSGTSTFGTVTHNAKEIYQAQSEGKIVIACNLDAMFYAPLSAYYQYASAGDTQTYELHFTSGEAHLSYTQMYDAGGSLLAEQSYFGGLIVSADGVTFDNEGTEFESTNVQAALEEIGTKIPSANGTAGQVWTKTETGAEWADTSGGGITGQPDQFVGFNDDGDMIAKSMLFLYEGENTRVVEIHLTDYTGAPCPDFKINGVHGLQNAEVWTNASGYASGIADTDSVTLTTDAFEDLASVSYQVNAVPGETTVVNWVIPESAFTNFVRIDASRTVTISPLCKRLDVNPNGGGVAGISGGGGGQGVYSWEEDGEYDYDTMSGSAGGNGCVALRMWHYEEAAA